MVHTMVRRGMVLRVKTPFQTKVTVFDELLGNIAIVPQAPVVPLVHGHLIAYHLEPWKHLYRAYDVQVMTLPAAWVCEDIWFLHHVLEMARHFLPEESCAASVFRLCMFLYEAEAAHHERALLKKLFLGKFFALLGVYPDEALQHDRELFHLFAGSGERMPEELEDTDELHKKLRRWLLGCIQTHPHGNTFTTMQFLYRQDENEYQ